MAPLQAINLQSAQAHSFSSFFSNISINRHKILHITSIHLSRHFWIREWKCKQDYSRKLVQKRKTLDITRIPLIRFTLADYVLTLHPLTLLSAGRCCVYLLLLVGEKQNGHHLTLSRLTALNIPHDIVELIHRLDQMRIKINERNNQFNTLYSRAKTVK